MRDKEGKNWENEVIFNRAREDNQKSRVERNAKGLALKYIKLEIPVRSLRETVKQTGGYNSPGWRYKIGSRNMEWDNVSSKCRQRRGPRFSD